jgi:uncharacterized protein YndB with AHSA1/START domain
MSGHQGAVMNTISSTIDINASPQIVWGVLTDSARLPEWSTFILSMHGPLELATGWRFVSNQPAGGK